MFLVWGWWIKEIWWMVGKCVVVSDFAGQFSSAEINRHCKRNINFNRHKNGRLFSTGKKVQNIFSTGTKMVDYFQQVQRIFENAFIYSTGTKMFDYFSTGKKGIVHETKYLTLTLTIQQVIQRKFFFNRYWRLKKFFNRHFRIIPYIYKYTSIQVYTVYIIIYRVCALPAHIIRVICLRFAQKQPYLLFARCEAS